MAKLGDSNVVTENVDLESLYGFSDALVRETVKAIWG